MKIIHKALMTSAIVALTVPLSAPSSAQPQEENKREEGTALEEITVTGYRATMQAIVDAKREFDVISDSIGNDEMGSLPDFNLAEAMQRIPGVSTDQSRGEERFVIIRGMDSEYNFSTIDGLVLPSTDNASRAVLFDIIPSSAVRRVDILKSFSADMDGQGIGGAIDLVTRSAFDSQDMYFVANAAIGTWQYRNKGHETTKPARRADITIADRFGADDQFGFMVSGNYWLRDNYSLSPTTSGNSPFYFYDADLNRLPNNAPEVDESSIVHTVPENASIYLYKNERERIGTIGKLEFKSSSSDLYAHIQGFYFKRTDDETRDHHRLRNLDGNIPPENLTATSGTVVGRAEGAMEGQEEYRVDIQKGAQAGLNYGFADVHRIKARAGYTVGTFDNERFHALFHRPTSLDQGFSYELSKDEYLVATPTNPEIFSGPENYRMFRSQFDWQKNKEDIKEGRLDYSWNVEPSSQGVGLMTGATVRRFERTRDNERAEYRPVGGVFTLDGYTEDYSYIPPVFTVPMIFVDVGGLRSLDFSDPTQFAFQNSSNTASVNADYQIKENVNAAYAMAVWNGPSVRLRGGLRYEDTKVRARASQNIGGTFEPFETDTSYSNWLPRVDVMYDVTDDFRVRAAYSKSIGRPDYDQLAPYRSVNFDPVLGRVTISGGNPSLNPRKSDNFDISFEYYFPDSEGILSIGLFHKKINDEIFTRRTYTEEFLYEDVLVELVTAQPENMESAKLSGIEIGLIKNTLDFLPEIFHDFGISGNLAYIKSSGEVVVSSDEFTGEVVTRELFGLINQPKWTANASLFYRKGDFEGRIAYNYKSKYLTALPVITQGWLDRIYASRSMIDTQMRYWLTDNLRIQLDVKNITNSSAHETFAYGLHHTRRIDGRAFWLGATFRY